MLAHTSIGQNNLLSFYVHLNGRDEQVIEGM